MSKTKTIDKILTAAEKEIASKGIDGTKLEKIAHEAGVTKQLIYHYFKSKDNLYKAVLETVSNRKQLLSNVEFYQAYSPEEAICEVINTILDSFIKNPGFITLTLDQALHDGEHISEGSCYVSNMQQFIVEIIEPILTRGAQGGVFKAGLDAHMTFWVIYNLATSCFLNQKVMSKASNIDFSSANGIELWRKTSTEFTLAALRP